MAAGTTKRRPTSEDAGFDAVFRARSCSVLQHSFFHTPFYQVHLL